MVGTAGCGTVIHTSLGRLLFALDYWVDRRQMEYSTEPAAASKIFSKLYLICFQ
jgi:mRNA degradation ribonuclease J1/J2